jgi:hypothetical protein
MNHKAKIVNVAEVADGIVAVRVRCCGDESTDSVLSVHELHRTEKEFDADVAAHCARVEKMHADRARAKAHIERLLKK